MIKIKIYIVVFLCLAITTILQDPYMKYERLNAQYNNTLPLNVFVEMLVQCEKLNAPLNMIVSISYRESGFKNIVGQNGNDIGVMQINRSHVRPNEKFEDYFNVRKNIREGIQTFQSALKKAKGDLRKALAYYNAGENYNLENYTKEQWIKYVDFITRNYCISNDADKIKIKVD